MLGTKLGEMPITLRIHTPYANLLTDDFLEKHSGCLGAFGPSAAAAAFGRHRPPLRLDDEFLQAITLTAHFKEKNLLGK